MLEPSTEAGQQRKLRQLQLLLLQCQQLCILLAMLIATPSTSQRGKLQLRCCRNQHVDTSDVDDSTQCSMAAACMAQMQITARPARQLLKCRQQCCILCC